MEGSPTADFESRKKGALGLERLTLKRFRERASFTGDPGRYVKKGFGFGHLHRGPFTAEFERCMKEGSSNRASLSDGLHEGDLEGGLLYWGPQKIC